MRAGQLRLTAIFQRQATTQDTAGQRDDTWTEIDTCRVSVLPVSGREYFNASGERAEVTHEVRLRYRSSLSTLAPDDRAVIGSRTFDIRSVINVRERKRELQLMCTEVVT